MTKPDLDRFLTDPQFHVLAEHAAFLGREFLARAEAIRFTDTENKGRIVYLLDTDILDGFAASYRVGPILPGGGRGYGALLPRRHPLPDERGLTKEESDALRDSHILEDRLAVNVVRLLTESAVNLASSSYGRSNTSLKKANDRDFDVYMSPGHFTEATNMKLHYSGAANDQQNAAGDKARSARLESHQSQIHASFNKWHKQEAELNVAQVVDEIMEIIMMNERQSDIGAANIAYQMRRVEHHKFDWDTFAKTRLSENFMHRDVDDKLEELEDVAKSFLRWYFGSQLSSKLKSFSHLDRKSSESTSDTSYNNDVDALIDLALMNRRLLENGAKTRIVLITCDRTLAKAAYLEEKPFSRRLDGLIQNYLDAEGHADRQQRTKLLGEFFKGLPDRGKWFDRFGLHYVQHLHALAHDDIAENPQAQFGDVMQAEDLATIFSGMFGYQAATVFDNQEELENIARGNTRIGLPSDPKSEYRKSIEDWNDLSWRAVRTDRVSQIRDERADTFETIAALLEEHRQGDGTSDENADLVKRAALRIDDYLEQLRDKATLQFSDLGTELLIRYPRIGTNPRWIARNPPDLCFSVLKQSRKMFDRLSKPSPIGYSNARAEEFQSDYDDLYKDVSYLGDHSSGRHRERLEIYLKFLVLGAAFAAAEKWSVAQHHARKAIAALNRAEGLGERIPDYNDEEGRVAHISGREAYFLAAVCAKTLASSDKDLRDASEFLRISDTKHVIDLAAGDNANTVRMKLRHIAETLSIEQARYYLTRSSCRSGRNADGAPVICDHGDAPICSDCHDAQQKLENSADGILTDPEAIHFLADPKNPSLSDMSLSLYIIQLHAIRTRFTEHGNGTLKEPVSKNDWRDKSWLVKSVDCLEFIRTTDNGNGRFLFSDLANIYMLIGKTMLDPDRLPEEINDRGKVERIFGDPRKKAVTHFDEWRLGALRKYISGILEAQVAT